VHFLNPLALLGMVATIIPLAIHLLHRGRSSPLPFSNLRFLRALDQTRMRSLRLRQWLVLLLRTLVVALIILAFSRPSFKESGTGLLGSSVPTAAVILLDRSYSSAYRQPAGRLFDLLRGQATALLSLFSPRDEVTVVPFAARPEQVLENPDRLRELIQELAPGEGITDIEAALERAAQLLTSRVDWNREILLLTDLARYNWSDVTPRDADWLPGASVYVSDPADGERANIYIRDLLLDSWMQTAGRKHTIHVVFGNSSSRPATATSADLYVNGERIQRREFDLPAGDFLQTDFTFTPRGPGPLSGYVEIEDDGLVLDNRRYFTLYVPESLQVLLVGAERGDTYYARRALTAGSSIDPVLDVRQALMEELSPEILAGTNVVALCNLVRLSPERTRLLHDYAADGGGIIIFPSPRVDLSYLNRHLLPALVPATVKGRRGVPGSDGSQYQRLDPSRPYHLLFDGLLSSDSELPRFWASFEILPKPDLKTLAFFDDGHPALVEGRVAAGRVLLFAGPLDLTWNDLPRRGIFVPLLHRLSRYLSLPPDQGLSYLVGQTAQRQLPSPLSAGARVQAESPSGRKFHLEAELSSGRTLWKVPILSESGLWRLLSEGEVVDRFPVNVDTRESDLGPIPVAELARIFGSDRLRLIRPDDDLREAVLRNRYGRELWRECLILAVCLLLWELWLSRAPREKRAAAT
jgi:hypothetical protein